MSQSFAPKSAHQSHLEFGCHSNLLSVPAVAAGLYKMDHIMNTIIYLLCPLRSFQHFPFPRVPHVSGPKFPHVTLTIHFHQRFYLPFYSYLDSLLPEMNESELLKKIEAVVEMVLERMYPPGGWITVDS